MAQVYRERLDFAGQMDDPWMDGSPLKAPVSKGNDVCVFMCNDDELSHKI